LRAQVLPSGVRANVVESWEEFSAGELQQAAGICV
jgi:hypothetical protein